MGEMAFTDRLIAEIKKVIIGKDEVISKIVMAMIAGGNVLLEDLPGVGKTTLAMALGRATDLKVKRVQFTPDVMPSDVTGFSMYNNQTGKLEYVEGAAVTNILLADEINRTSPRTQAALLEVMEEGQVTVDGVTRKVLSPFFVIATQNPYGLAGTNKLPESQLDRFMVRLSIGYPSVEAEKEILKNNSGKNIDDIVHAMGKQNILDCIEQVKEVHVDDSMYEYIARIAQMTRQSEYLDIGMSTRASKALVDMAKASAVVNHRSYMLTSDIQNVIMDCILHRLKLSSKANSDGVNEMRVLTQIIKRVPVPSV